MTWQAVNLGAAEFARPTELPYICGVIYRGKRHGLSGPPESAKTIAACIFGLEHMRSGAGQFALVDFEMGEHATRLLLEDLGATPDEIAHVYYVAPDGPPDTADIDAIEAAGVTLVIIDAAAGAYDVSGLDDYKRADVEAFSRAWVKPLWLRGITTILLDHVTKNAESRGKYSIGSERKLGTVDVHLGLEAIKAPHRGGTGLIRITTHKDRPGHLPRPTAGTLRLDSAPDSHKITWTFAPETGSDEPGADTWKPTVLMEKVSRYLVEQPEPVSRGTIALHVGGQRKWILAAIDHLIADGYAAETPGPRGSKLTTSIHPFCVPDPFSPVPENGTPTTRSAFSLPTRENADENGSDELERLEDLGREMGLT